MAKKQQLINLLSNIANLATNILMGLFFTPYLVETLGIAAYGVLPLALVINSYINVVTGALIGSMSRFYSIELVAQRYKEASEYLSIGFVSLGAFSILLLPLIIAFITNIGSVLNIPDMYIDESQILFAYIIASFLLSMCSSLLNITQFAMNRLDIMNVIKIGRNIFKVMFVLLFFSLNDINLRNIGLAFFLSEVVVFATSMFFYKKETNKNIAISFKLFNQEKFKVVLNMIFWVLLLHVGEVVLFRMDNIIINKFWSTSESGIVGVFTEFGMYVNSVIAVVISLASPLIVIHYSKQNYKEMTSVFLNNYAVTNYFLIIILSTCICYAPQILEYWLNDTYIQYSTWFCGKLLFVPFIIYISIYNTLFRVYNKLKVPSFIMIASGIIGVIFMCIVANHSSNFTNPIIVVLGMGFGSLIINMFLSSIYLNKINSYIKIKSLFRPLFDLVVFIGISLIVSRLLKMALPCVNIISFIVDALITSVAIAALMYKLTLPKEARTYLLRDLISRKA